MAAIDTVPPPDALSTPAGASAYMGAAYFAALAARILEARPHAPPLYYDCGDREGNIMGGLRMGVRLFVMDEVPPALERLVEAYGAAIIPRSFQAINEKLTRPP